MPVDVGKGAIERFELKWTLARKIGGLAAMLLALVLAIAGYNYYAIEGIRAEMSEILDTDLPVTKLITQIESAQLEQHVALERILRLGNQITPAARVERDSAAADFANLTRQIAADADKANEAVDRAARITVEYQKYGEQVRLLQKEHQDFATTAAQVIALALAGKSAEADRLTEQVEKEAADVDHLAAKMLTDIERFTAESAKSAEDHQVNARTVSAGLSVTGIVAAILLSFLFIRSLGKSVTGVTDLAVQIASGNLRQDKLVVRSTDEMGQLALIFNNLLESLTDNVSQTRAAAASLNAAVGEIAASAKEQAASVTEQAAAVQETTATMEEIAQSGNQIADRSRQVAAAAEATSTATNLGLDAALNSTKTMDAIQQQAETVAENIVTLSEKTQAVGEIIASVTDIAEQSNLLALNAAIEAAAAGEQGRSFAVVANEIKNLADQAKEATGKVRSILGDIQKGINTSVMLTEEVVKRVDTGKKQTDVVERTIRHMAESVNSSIQAFQQITAATGQQQIGVDQVTQALKNIRQASDQTAVSTNQLEKAATNLTVLGHQLSTNVEKDPDVKDFRQRLLATFQVEHNEHVQRIRETLTAAEASDGAPAPADLDEAFRRAHSMKGAARAVDLRSIENLAHRLETLFARIRTGDARLDKPVIKVVHQVLDASEDGLASLTSGREYAEPVEVLQAIDNLLATPASVAVAEQISPRASDSEPALRTERGEGAPASERVGGLGAKPPDQLDTVRLTAESLDRIVSSAGQLMTETLRQTQITRRLRDISRSFSDTAAERQRARKMAAGEFRQLENSPELASAARYLNYLDHQVHVLSTQVRLAVRVQERNAWTLRAVSGELQRDVRQARMVPAGTVFEGFRKMVRDVAKDDGKVAELHVSGGHVAADRVVLQALKDPVMHMLRNAISHGLESEAERRSRGKRPEGRIDLVIEARGNQLCVTVEDDGRGMDLGKVAEIAVRKGIVPASEIASRSPEELRRLVLLPAFSTSGFVTDLSGRGMGLSVVAEAAARLQGTVDIGVGTNGGARVSISAPLSVSSHRLLLVTCQRQTFAIPLQGIERLHRVAVSEVQTIASIPVIHVAGQPIPVVSLAHLLHPGEPRVTAHQNTLCVMVMRSGLRRLAVAVDAFLSEREAIVKELPVPANADGKIAGGILLEDGAVCLVLNPIEIVDGFQQSSSALALTPEATESTERKTSLNILVVDDSLTTRTLEKSVLEAHGYQVAIAVDGVEALNHLRAEPVGLVITDVEMPRLDGFGLLEEMKRGPRLGKIPVIIVTSLENPADQARGLALGADAYIVKRRFEQRALLETIRQIL